MVNSATSTTCTAAAQPASPPRTRKRMSRQELTPLAREALLNAAERVVGEVGYAEASVARITSAAGVAQGTFYLYFESRQSLFDELLPHARSQMLAGIRERLARASDFFEVEGQGLAAFLDYVRANPGFLRVLNEAESVAAATYRAHYDDIAGRYRRELTQAMQSGQVRTLAPAEIETVIYLMMGARVSLYQRCRGACAGETANTVEQYMDMLRAWLVPQPPASAAGAQPRTEAARATA